MRHDTAYSSIGSGGGCPKGSQQRPERGTCCSQGLFATCGLLPPFEHKTCHSQWLGRPPVPGNSAMCIHVVARACLVKQPAHRSGAAIAEHAEDPDHQQHHMQQEGRAGMAKDFNGQAETSVPCIQHHRQQRGREAGGTSACQGGHCPTACTTAQPICQALLLFRPSSLGLCIGRP